MAKKQPPVTLKIEGSWEDVAAKLLTVPAKSVPARSTDKRKTAKKKTTKKKR